MRKIFLTAVIIVPLFSLAQFGIKAGVNFANVTNASEINSGSESGFMAGIFLLRLQLTSLGGGHLSLLAQL